MGEPMHGRLRHGVRARIGWGSRSPFEKKGKGFAPIRPNGWGRRTGASHRSFGFGLHRLPVPTPGGCDQEDRLVEEGSLTGRAHCQRVTWGPAGSQAESRTTGRSSYYARSRRNRAKRPDAENGPRPVTVPSIGLVSGSSAGCVVLPASAHPESCAGRPRCTHSVCSRP